VAKAYGSNDGNLTMRLNGLTQDDRSNNLGFVGMFGDVSLQFGAPGTPGSS